MSIEDKEKLAEITVNSERFVFKVNGEVDNHFISVEPFSLNEGQVFFTRYFTTQKGIFRKMVGGEEKDPTIELVLIDGRGDPTFSFTFNKIEVEDIQVGSFSYKGEGVKDIVEEHVICNCESVTEKIIEKSKPKYILGDLDYSLNVLFHPYDSRPSFFP